MSSIISLLKNEYKKWVPERIRLQIWDVMHQLEALKYEKGDYYCPCCEKSSSSFISKGNGLVNRENAICPKCRSLERTRILHEFLKNETQAFSEPLNILHFAPEKTLKRKMSKNPNYLDVDINPLLATKTMDIQKIPIADNCIDLIICSHVLGHVPDENRALEEMYRVLKPNGQLLIMTILNQNDTSSLENPEWKTEKERLIHYGAKDLLRLHGRDSLFQKIENQGFKEVEIIDYRENFSPEQRKNWSLGNGERELIFRAVK